MVQAFHRPFCSSHDLPDFRIREMGPPRGRGGVHRHWRLSDDEARVRILSPPDSDGARIVDTRVGGMLQSRVSESVGLRHDLRGFLREARAEHRDEACTHRICSA